MGNLQKHVKSQAVPTREIAVGRYYSQGRLLRKAELLNRRLPRGIGEINFLLAYLFIDKPVEDILSQKIPEPCMLCSTAYKVCSAELEKEVPENSLSATGFITVKRTLQIYSRKYLRNGFSEKNLKYASAAITFLLPAGLVSLYYHFFMMF